MKFFSEEVKLIAVIGMHRSGTSLVTRSLQCLGYDLGNRLIASGTDNPKGYWEDSDILDLDIEMLKFLQRDWDSILPVREKEIEKLCSQGYLEKGVRLLQEKQQNFVKYAFKDPRMTKLLPFWNKVFSSLPIKPFFLHVVRNPINVFQSLQKRNGMDLIQSLLLWLEHTITGLRYTDLEFSALINYDELVDFPRKSLEKIATVLNLSIDNGEFKTFEAEILDQNLRHNIETWKNSSSNILFPLVEEVYSVLANCSLDGLKELAKTCEEWEEKFQNLFKKNTVQRILNDQQYQFKIDQLDSKNQNLNSEILNLNSDFQQLKISLSEKDRELASLYQSRSWRVTKPLRFLSRIRHSSFRKLFSLLRRKLDMIYNYYWPIETIKFDELQDKQFIGYKRNKTIAPVVKVIAFYLPQFHPFRENDLFWGKGFTEWNNVGKAMPNYIGHHQPHCPLLGYYDLRIPEVMEEQAQLAKEYGIYGFAYYFYWFDGRPIMDKPLEMLLENPNVDINFFFFWANENWTRKWDGLDNEVLLAQKHSQSDSIAFIRHLIKFFKDDRYIRVDNKPVLAIYRAAVIPDIEKMIIEWRREVKRHGISDLYIIGAQTFGEQEPQNSEIDAMIEFPPHFYRESCDLVNDTLTLTNPNYNGAIHDYAGLIRHSLSFKEPSYKKFNTVMLSWDNTARMQNNSLIFHNFSVIKYKQWLSLLCNRVYSNQKYSLDEKFVFINAWNEWAEGTHLEPDTKFGYAYLQATYDAIFNYDAKHLLMIKRCDLIRRNQVGIIVHLHYPELWETINNLLENIGSLQFDLYVTVTSNRAIESILSKYPRAYIRLVENRGRDILPFINLFRDISGLGYTVICKLHSKKTLYRTDGEKISSDLYHALLGEGARVDEIIQQFINDQSLGILIPSKYKLFHNEKNMHHSSKSVLEVCEALNIDFRDDEFPAGSMFWFRPESLAGLEKICHTKFKEESGYVDGTYPHAVERIFCLLAKKNLFSVKGC